MIRNNTRTARYWLIGIIAVVAVLPACAWQRIPTAPSFASGTPIPLTVGVQLSDSETSSYYGPKVVKLLSQMSVVDKLVYPYREGDAVDGVLRIAVDGSWAGSGFGAGFVVGLTLGLLSPVVGPSMKGTHDLRATLTADNAQVSSHSAHIETTVTWGIAGNANEVGAKADNLQSRKIAVEIAEWLQANRRTILEQIQ